MRTQTFRPRTKHLNWRMHHFRSYADDTKEITIQNIDTLNKLADLLTKPLNYSRFIKFCKMVMGWEVLTLHIYINITFMFSYIL